MQKLDVSAVLLDAGGVLLHPNLDWIEATAAKHGITVTRDALHLAYYKAIYSVDVQDVGQRGGMAVDNEEIRRFLVIKLLVGAGSGLEQAEAAAGPMAAAAAERFPRESDIYDWAMPGVREKVERLRATGVMLGVASNNDGGLESQLRNIGVRDLFEVRLDSAIEGVAKPDPELLLRAAERMGVEPASCLFVGDIDRVDGAAARAAGMPFVLIDPLMQPRPSGARMVRDLDELVSIVKH